MTFDNSCRTSDHKKKRKKKERGKEECDKCGKNMYQPLYVRSAFDDDFDDDNNNNKACGRSPLFFVRAREEGGEEERDSTQKKVRCRTHTMIPKKREKERQKYLSFLRDNLKRVSISDAQKKNREVPTFQRLSSSKRIY